MEPPSHRYPLTAMRLQHRVPGADAVTVRKDLRLVAGAPAIDVYHPPMATDGPRPWVVFVNGLPDAGARRILGCAIKDMASYDSWGRAVAAWGMVGITHATDTDPAADLRQVWTMLCTHGEELGLAPGRGALWACSSHVPNALGLLADSPAPPRAAVCCYGFMLDLDGAEGVADAQRVWHFANPAAGRRVDELTAVPTLVVRAGHDETRHVNTSIDAFVRRALAANFPLTLVNYAAGQHAFDLVDTSAASATVVMNILAFLGAHTAGPTVAEDP